MEFRTGPPLIEAEPLIESRTGIEGGSHEDEGDVETTWTFCKEVAGNSVAEKHHKYFAG
jgi:hypothetical protein